MAIVTNIDVLDISVLNNIIFIISDCKARLIFAEYQLKKNVLSY